MPRKSSIPSPFPTDEESIEARRERAHAEQATVQSVDAFTTYFGLFHVTSTERSSAYAVEIRTLNANGNACECLDYMTNRLGTCKHIERVLQHLCQGSMVDFAEAAAAGSPCIEVFVDMQAMPPVVRVLIPEEPNEDVLACMAPYFGTNGELLDAPLDAIPQLNRAVKQLSDEHRSHVRLSQALTPWSELLARRERRERDRHDWLSDVCQGKRERIPVRLPMPPYQVEGMLHLAFGERAMLADEMGLGKTVQALAACELLRDYRNIERVLIVTPNSLRSEWLRHITDFTHSSATLVTGAHAIRQRTYREQHAYHIVTYDQVRSDIDDINTILAPDIVILDEAQRIKNWPTRTAKSVKQLESPFAFVLTGTPLGDRLEELYSLIEFLDPHLFGALFRFQREFFGMNREGKLRPRNLAELHRRVNSVMLRRRKTDVEDELPPCTVNTFYVTMVDEQRRAYDVHAGLAKQALDAAQGAAESTPPPALQHHLDCMRKLCDSGYLLDPHQTECPKSVELVHILDETLANPENKVLIFSEWGDMLKRLSNDLDARDIPYRCHTSDMPQSDRDPSLKQFRDSPNCNVLLCNDASAADVNLDSANIVINFDQPWQANQRQRRIACTRSKKRKRAITVIDLVTRDSIEASIAECEVRQTSLADRVLDGALAQPNKHESTTLDRVATLLNMPQQEAAPPHHVNDGVKEELLQALRACAPDGLLRVEATLDLSLLIIVINEGGPEKLIMNTCKGLLPAATVKVITERAYEAITALTREGVLNVAVDLQQLV
ncbi:MAG: superfamily II DNA or RNA helicase [Candidatus Promineifilaceae bacterium]|jgi:superfamily II DNA or RNA helicase